MAQGISVADAEGAHRGVEPALPGNVRLSRGPDLRGTPRRRRDPLQRAARRVRRHRPGAADRQAARAHEGRQRVRDPAPAPQRPRVRDARPADAGRRLRHDVHGHHRVQAHRTGTDGGQAHARAARRRAHVGALPRAARPAGREAAGRAGQCDQDPVRGGGEPRPAAAAERGAPVRIRAGGAYRRPGVRRNRRADRRRDPRGRGSARRHARHRAPRERHDARRGHGLRPADLLDELARQFAPVAARRGLRLRFTADACRVHSDRVLCGGCCRT